MSGIKFWQSSRLRYAIVAGLVIAFALSVVWWTGLFQYARLRLNDIYFVPLDTSDNIVIIGLDEASLQRYGRSPSEWSRDIYADMVDNLISANPRVLAFDLLFSEVEAADEQFADALSRLRQNDARTRIVLATAGINNISSQANPSEIAVFTFANTLAISPQIAEQADYQGYTNTLPDTDSIVRRQASLIQSIDGEGYTFSIATYLAYLRIPGVAAGQVVVPGEQSLSVTAEREIPVDDFGFWQPYYFAPPSTPQNSAFSIVSFVDVVDGNADMTMFEDKIVLVGLINTTALLDQYLAPSSTNGALMAGVEIQANALESLIQDTFVQPLSTLNQIVIIVATSLIASLGYAYLRWYFKAGLLVIFALVWFLIASTVFSLSFISISLFDILLALVVPFIVSLGIDITVERRERQQKEFLLNSVQKIAEQRLQLEQGARYILNDVQHLAPDFESKLYLQDVGQADTYKLFQLDETSGDHKYQPVNKSYDELFQLHPSPAFINFPIAWQQQNHGLLTISHSQKQKLNRQSQTGIEELMARLAPHINNLLLHHEIERQKSLLDAVIAESPASIAIVDNDARVIQHNDDLSDLFGNENDHLRGQVFHDLICNIAENADLKSLLLEGFQQQKLFHIDEIKIGASVVSLDAAPIANYGVWAIIIGDITSLVELSELKTQMLRIAAHDLKNPLGRIMGFAELLEMQLDLDERQSRYLSIISKASLEMKDIIADILNLERLRSTKLKLEPVKINRILLEVSSSHQPDIIQKNQQFDMQLPETTLYVNADIGQLSQAITNLIGNAIKYTPDDGKITVRLHQEDKRINFEVEDTGYGIPQDAQEKLFTEFYRAKSEATSHIQGTGLGLSLVKSVIEAHGGQIGFTSEENIGSTFYFSLPVLEMDINDDTA